MQIKRRRNTDIDKGRLSMNTVDAVQNDDDPPNPTPSNPLRSPHPAQQKGIAGILHMCSTNKTTSKKN